MKKMMIAAAMMTAVLSMTGCSANINIAAPTENIANAAESTTTAAAAAIETAAATSAASSATTAAAQTSAQTAPAATAAQTTATTVQTEATQTKAVTTLAVNAPAEKTDCTNFAGTWYYQEQKGSDSKLYYENCGVLKITADGTFTYQPNDGSAAKKGIVKKQTEDYADGTKCVIYGFYDEKDTFWTGFYEPVWGNDRIYLGQDIIHRIINDENNTRLDAPSVTITPSTVQSAFKDPSNGLLHLYECTVPYFECETPNDLMRQNMYAFDDELQDKKFDPVDNFKRRGFIELDYNEAEKAFLKNPIGQEKETISYELFLYNNTCTVKLNSNLYGGGAHGINAVEAMLVDLSTMKVIRDVSELTDSLEDFLNFAVDYYFAHYSDKYLGQDGWNIDNLKRALCRDETWYIANDMFCLEFSEYALGSTYAEGAPVLEIPLKDCLPYFNNYGKSIFES